MGISADEHSAQRLLKQLHLLLDLEQTLCEFHLAALDILDLLLEQLPGVVVVLIAPPDFLLELVDVDLDVALDLLVPGLEHVLELGSLVLEVQDDERVVRQLLVYFQDF